MESMPGYNVKTGGRFRWVTAGLSAALLLLSAIPGICAGVSAPVKTPDAGIDVLMLGNNSSRPHEPTFDTYRRMLAEEGIRLHINPTQSWRFKNRPTFAEKVSY